MRALLDTDAFCKLAVGGVLHDGVQLLGANLQECGRLAALPYMLRRGRLRTVFGAEACDVIIPIAEGVPLAPHPSDLWLERLIPIAAIDPGEAQIFAAAAETGLFLVSGDKRALRALNGVADFANALVGRIATFEAVLIGLCDHLGSDEVRRRVQVLTASDKVVQVCFSAENPDPQEALLSYQRSLADEVSRLVLWNPQQGGRT